MKRFKYNGKFTDYSKINQYSITTLATLLHLFNDNSLQSERFNEWESCRSYLEMNRVGQTLYPNPAVKIDI